MFAARFRKVFLRNRWVGATRRNVADFRPRLERLEDLTLPCTITWSGPGVGDWNDPASWTPSRVPDATDDVCIASTSTIALPAAPDMVTIQSLTLGQAHLSGTSDVTITESLTWTSGTLSGQGTTTVLGGMSISGPGNKALQNNRWLENAATATWTGFGEILLSSGGVLANLKGATFNIQGDSFLSQIGGGGSRFENAGLVLRSASAGETGMDTPFVNQATGTLDLRTGSFFFANNMTNDGVLLVSAGAMAVFESGTHTHAAGSTVSGAGTLVHAGGSSTLAGAYTVAGTTRISGGSVFVNADASTGAGVLSAGTLGGSATFTVNAQLTWSGGQMTGTGTTEIAKAAQLTISDDVEKPLIGRTVRNHGTATWQGSGWIRAESSAQFMNQGTFNADADANFIGIGNPAPAFTNAGMFRKGGAGSSSVRFDVGIIFTNEGQVEAASGTLAVSTGSATGTFEALANATLVFRDGEYNLNQGSRVHGEGTVVFNGATVSVLGQYEAPAETQINGGRVTFSGPDPRLRSGVFVTGTLDGDSDVTVLPNRTFDWIGGTMTGAGKTVVANGATFGITGSFAKLLDGRNLQNEGTITWSSPFSAQNGALWDNLASSLVEAGNAGMGFGGEGDTPAFYNAGYFRKVDTATTQFQENVTVTNAGIFEILPGRLTILGTFTNFSSQTLTGGVYFLAGTLQFVGADVRTNDADVTLSGADSEIINQGGGNGLANFRTNNVRFALEEGRSLQVGLFDNTGELNVAEGCTFTATGLFTWTGGLMHGGGTLALNAGWTLNSEAELTLSGLQVNLGGMSTWTAGDLLAGDGARITVLAGATWNIPIDANAYHTGGDEVLIVNLGTVRKTAGLETATFGAGIAFTNTGTLQVDVGTLALSGGLTNFNPTDGTLTDGTFVLFGGLVVPGVSIVTNRANITLNGADAAFLDEASASAFRTLAVHVAGRTLLVLNGASLATSAATFTNGGPITVSGGSAFTAEGNVTNNAAWTVANSSLSVTGALLNMGGGANLNINAGSTVSAATFTQAGGTAALVGGTLDASVVVQGGTFNAHGTINGSLELRGGQFNIGGTSTGTLQVNGDFTQTGGTLQIQIRNIGDYDILNVSGTATLGGTLQVRMIGAYRPDSGDSFQFLNAMAVDGVFNTLDSTQADFDLAYNGTDVTLVTQ